MFPLRYSARPLLQPSSGAACLWVPASSFVFKKSCSPGLSLGRCCSFLWLIIHFYCEVPSDQFTAFGWISAESTAITSSANSKLSNSTGSCIHVHIITLPASCFTDDVLYFRLFSFLLHTSYGCGSGGRAEVKGLWFDPWLLHSACQSILGQGTEHWVDPDVFMGEWECQIESSCINVWMRCSCVLE